MFERLSGLFTGGGNDNAPLAWWGRFPVYGITWLVLAHCLCFLVTTAALPLGGAEWVSGLVFSNQAVLRDFAIWQVATYAFVHVPSLWFLIEMAMLYFFGVEVEKALGRRQFFVFYILLVLLPPLFLVAAGLFGPVLILQGSGAVQMALFLAFVALLPNLPFFFAIPARWVWAAFFGLNSFLALTGNGWALLTALWINTGATLVFLRMWGIPRPFFSGSNEVRIPRPPAPVRVSRPLRVSPKPPRQKRRVDPVENIDPILEKIAREGLGSLTAAEKIRLEKARAALLAKEEGR